MIELKVHTPKELVMQGKHNEPIYLKSEADKVFAHNKFKRCLDKAALCKSEEKRLDAIVPLFDTDREYWEFSSDYWNKWHKRWLELAEKFKEAK